jgi:N6-adenosine-specific RNA methylase IME4
MAAWGFGYKTHAIWDKVKLGMGYWFRGRHELLLVGTRGGFSPPPEEVRYPSVFAARRGEHSAKPECVYEMIESMFPGACRVEFFARKAREGWTPWGNQLCS